MKETDIKIPSKYKMTVDENNHPVFDDNASAEDQKIALILHLTKTDADFLIGRASRVLEAVEKNLGDFSEEELEVYKTKLKDILNEHGKDTARCLSSILALDKDFMQARMRKYSQMNNV